MTSLFFSRKTIKSNHLRANLSLFAFCMSLFTLPNKLTTSSCTPFIYGLPNDLFFNLCGGGAQWVSKKSIDSILIYGDWSNERVCATAIPVSVCATCPISNGDRKCSMFTPNYRRHSKWMTRTVDSSKKSLTLCAMDDGKSKMTKTPTRPTTSYNYYYCLSRFIAHDSRGCGDCGSLGWLQCNWNELDSWHCQCSSSRCLQLIR